jgi:hypothetical protein
MQIIKLSSHWHCNGNDHVSFITIHAIVRAVTGIPPGFMLIFSIMSWNQTS